MMKMKIFVLEIVESMYKEITLSSKLNKDLTISQSDYIVEERYHVVGAFPSEAQLLRMMREIEENINSSYKNCFYGDIADLKAKNPRIKDLSKWYIYYFKTTRFNIETEPQYEEGLASLKRLREKKEKEEANNE